MKISAPDILILQNTFLFSGIPEKELLELIESIPPEYASFEEDEVIFSPDSYEKSLGVIMSGSVRVTKGNSKLLVSVLKKGSLFGAAALFNNEERYVSTLTATEDTVCFLYSQSKIEKMIEYDSRIRVNYIRYLSERIRFLSSKVDSLIGTSCSEKLISFLHSESTRAGSNHLHLSLTEVSEKVGIGRASLYRELDKLEHQGLISRSGRDITLNEQIIQKKRIYHDR